MLPSLAGAHEKNLDSWVHNGEDGIKIRNVPKLYKTNLALETSVKSIERRGRQMNLYNEDELLCNFSYLFFSPQYLDNIQIIFNKLFYYRLQNIIQHVINITPSCRQYLPGTIYT